MDLQLLSTVFISVVIEALPFVLIGVLVSSLIEVFVSQDTIRRLMPKHRGISLLAASLLGLLFPMCECGIVPVVRRLVGKGVPVSVAMTFMLATPIVNPVVITSTAMAFAERPQMVISRCLGGVLVALTVGLVLELIYRDPRRSRGTLRMAAGATESHHHDHDHDHGHHRDHAHVHSHDHDHPSSRGLLGKLRSTLTHATDEFFSTGRYLVIGALLAALLQTVVSRTALATVGQHAVGSRVSLMGLAYGLSLCSEADAFVASTLTGAFLPGAVLAFLLLGPMIDVKNTLMLFGNFSPRFVLLLIALITVTVFGYSFLLGAVVPI